VIAVNLTLVSIINASIPARFRTYADTGPIVRRLIIARYAPVNLAVQVIRISDALQFSIAKVTPSVQPGQRVTEVYVQHFVEVRETASAINFALMVSASLLVGVTQAVQNINTAIIAYVFKNYGVHQTMVAHTMKNALKITSDRRNVTKRAT
jgi:hypothetical protein